MKAIFFAVVLFATVPCALAQQVGLIANIEGRKTVSLDGQWQTIVDPYETGYYDYRYLPSPDGYFKDAKPKTKSDLIEFDFDTSEPLKVRAFSFTKSPSGTRNPLTIKKRQTHAFSSISVQLTISPMFILTAKSLGATRAALRHSISKLPISFATREIF